MSSKPLVLSLPPTLNSLYRHRAGRIYKVPKANLWAEEAYWAFKAHTKTPPTDKPVSLLMSMFLTRTRDIDSSLKVVLDMLQGLLYYNDDQIVELYVKKTIDKKNPRIELLWEIL